MDKVRRSKPSKVDSLPNEIKKRLDEMLRDKQFSQGEILETVNQMILEAGLDEEATISRSGLSRHAQKVEAVGNRLRELRATSEALTAQLGDKPTGDTTKLILEMGRSQLFRAMQQQMMNPDDDAEVDIGMIKEAMLAAQRLESTAMRAHQREKEIRQAYAEEAAEAVTEELRGQDGMSEQLEESIRSILLGKA